MKINFTLLASVILSCYTAACSYDEECFIMPYTPDDNDIQIIEVSDGINDNNGHIVTRADYSGFHTSFEDGDAIGVYAVNGNSIVCSNVKFTLTDGTWHPEVKVVYNPKYKYFAYYPYKASHGYTPDFTLETLDNQFAAFIADANNKFWMADQSTKENFSASNLMVSQGEATSGRNIKFTMQHKRALAVIDIVDNVFENLSIPSNTGNVEIEFTGNVPYVMNGESLFLMKPSTITSIGGIKIKGAAGKYIRANGGEISGTYTATCALSSDGGTTFGSYSPMPSWLTITDERIDGQPVKFKASFDPSGSTTSTVVSTTSGNANNETLKAASPKTNVDLSMVDNAGNARTSRTTANCYLVHAPGTYRFPLVYGNAIKNGVTNSSAYHTDVVDANVIQTLVNHADVGITDPWLKNNGVTVDAIELLWQDAPQVITSVGLDGEYATFTVSSTDIAECNAVIVAKSGGTIVWSWHIWVTPETLSDLTSIDTGAHTYNVAPVNVGWVSPQTVITEYAGYHCKVKISANGSNYIFTVVQPNSFLVTSYSTLGYCTFYQWGRPIPEPGANGFSDMVHSVYGISGNTELKDSDYPSYSTTSATIGQTVQSPTVHYNSGITYCPWNGQKRNYWDMNQRYADNVTTATVKTVYDPCPPDFCVPTGNLFYYIGNGSSRISSNWDTVRKGKVWTIGGVSLFFPSTGCRYHNSNGLKAVGEDGYCWSSSASSELGAENSAWHLKIDSFWWNWSMASRTYGFAVRAVEEE